MRPVIARSSLNRASGTNDVVSAAYDVPWFGRSTKFDYRVHRFVVFRRTDKTLQNEFTLPTSVPRAKKREGT